MVTAKDTALFWLQQGISTIPLYHRSKKPLIPWTEFKSRLPSICQIEEWYQCQRNIAIVSGWQNLAILEFDDIDCYAAWMCLELNPVIRDGYKVMSNRGIHIYFYLDEPMRLTTVSGGLFELKTSGKLCTIPPSIHESGKAYTPLGSPDNVPVVGISDILNYSPISHPDTVIFPTAKKSKYAPVVGCNDTDAIPTLLQDIKILNFFPNASKVDDRFYRSHCPFHGHKENFWIDNQRNRCGCYAGCLGQSSLNVIDFFSRLRQVTKKEAIEELKKLL